MSVKSIVQKLLHGRYWVLPNRAIRWIRDRALLREIKKRQIENIVRTLRLDGLEFKFCVNAMDAGLSRELLRNDWRETISTKYLLDTFLRDGDVVLDIGANLGYFATMEAMLTPRNVVYAIEPVLENFNVLEINVAINKLTNLQTFNAAISSQDGESEILVSEHKNWSTMNKGAAKSIGATHSQKVETFTLARFRQEKMHHDPTLLRMDTEGFEYEIITGNAEFLRQHHVRLFIEVHPALLGRTRLIELLTVLKSIGYEIDNWVRNTGFDQKDAIFHPPKRWHQRLGGYGERSITMLELIEESRQWNPDRGPVNDPYIVFATRSS